MGSSALLKGTTVAVVDRWRSFTYWPCFPRCSHDGVRIQTLQAQASLPEFPNPQTLTEPPNRQVRSQENHQAKLLEPTRLPGDLKLSAASRSFQISGQCGFHHRFDFCCCEPQQIRNLVSRLNSRGWKLPKLLNASMPDATESLKKKMFCKSRAMIHFYIRFVK